MPRFTLMLGLGAIDDHIALAQTAEACGWDAVSVPDSIFFPRASESDYPYADTRAVRSALEYSPALDPLISLAAIATVTEHLRLYPGVLKVPVRQPLVLAKTLSSLCVLSNNRFSLGAGLSPWQEDFDYNGVNFQHRGRIMDECLEIIQLALSGEYFSYQSDHFSVGELKLTPAPSSPMPVLIGGHAKPALRRALRLGDGWISANTDRAELARLTALLSELREEMGIAENPEFQIHALDHHVRTVEDCEQLVEMGVTDICITPWNPYASDSSRDDKVRAVEYFATHILDPMKSA